MDTKEALITAIVSLVTALAGYFLRPKADKLRAERRAKKASLRAPAGSVPPTNPQ